MSLMLSYLHPKRLRGPLGIHLPAASPQGDATVVPDRDNLRLGSFVPGWGS